MLRPYHITELVHIQSIYSIFENHCSSDYSFSGETHDFWECLYVKKGQVCVCGDERVYNLQENDLIFHKPLELHKFFVEDKDGADLFIFSFKAEGSAMDFFKNKAFRLDSNQIDIIYELLQYLRDYPYPACPDENLFYKYMSRFEKDRIFSQLLTTYIYRLFLTLLNCDALPVASGTKDAVIFRDAVNFMTNHLFRNLSISEIARHSNTSQTVLKQIFQKYAGLGVHKYLLNLKINTAMQYLNENRSVTEISYLLGFSSQGHFSGSFKRVTGLSPIEYKATLANNNSAL